MSLNPPPQKNIFISYIEIYSDRGSQLFNSVKVVVTACYLFLFFVGLQKLICRLCLWKRTFSTCMVVQVVFVLVEE